MKYILHKISEGFIITSNEKIIKDDSFYNTIDEVVYHNAVGWEILNKHTENEDIDLKIIAQEHQINFSSLSEAEQKRIGWFDVEKLFKQSLLNYKPEGIYKSDILKDVINNGISRNLGFRDGLEIGFKKSQHLLSDRMFTLEDMKAAFYVGVQLGINQELHIQQNKPLQDEDKVFNRTIQSLSQKSWTVELEMQDYFESGHGGEFPAQRIRLTNSKIKILKLL